MPDRDAEPRLQIAPGAEGLLKNRVLALLGQQGMRPAVRSDREARALQIPDHLPGQGTMRALPLGIDTDLALERHGQTLELRLRKGLQQVQHHPQRVRGGARSVPPARPDLQRQGEALHLLRG